MRQDRRRLLDEQTQAICAHFEPLITEAERRGDRAALQALSRQRDDMLRQTNAAFVAADGSLTSPVRRGARRLWQTSVEALGSDRTIGATAAWGAGQAAGQGPGAVLAGPAGFAAGAVANELVEKGAGRLFAWLQRKLRDHRYARLRREVASLLQAFKALRSPGELVRFRTRLPLLLQEIDTALRARQTEIGELELEIDLLRKELASHGLARCLSRAALRKGVNQVLPPIFTELRVVADVHLTEGGHHRRVNKKITDAEGAWQEYCEQDLHLQMDRNGVQQWLHATQRSVAFGS